MSIIEAIKTGKPIRLKNRTFTSKNSDPFMPAMQMVSEAWKDPEWLLSVVHLTIDDILSDQWEAKEGGAL